MNAFLPDIEGQSDEMPPINTKLNQRLVSLVTNYKLSYLWFIFFFLAYISSFFLSGSFIPSTDLDPSYQAVLEYARVHNFQFGRDIIFTFGPLGFLNTPIGQGFLADQRIVFSLLWSGIVAWSVTGLALQISGKIKYIFLIWFLVYSSMGTPEQNVFMVMVSGCMIFMGDVQKRKAASAVLLIIFALLALVKFNIFIAITVSIGLCAFVHICKREYKTSFFLVMTFGAVFAALWVVLGQNLENLYPWIRGSFEIAEGYTDAMTIFPKVSVLGVCTLAGAIYLAAFCLIILSARLSISNVGILIVTTMYLFLSWKHSFVRADGHTLDYIFFLPIAFSVLVTNIFQNTMRRKPRLYLSTFFIVSVILCNWAADFQEPGIMLSKLIDWPHRMMTNSRLIIKSATGNGKDRYEMLRSSTEVNRLPDLPATRALVKGATVDVYNYTQWAALANNLNYHPRPVIQGYSVYTPYLQDLNLSFYRSEKRPKYLLLKIETIDNRLPALDDATILPLLLSSYKPVAKEGGFLVLKSSKDSISETRLTLIHDQAVAFGHAIDLSSYAYDLLIMKVEVKPTLLGRVMKFLFQSPVLTLHVTTNGNTVGYRFISSMAERGFIVSPLLLTNSDVMNYFDGKTGNRLDSISFAKSDHTLGQLLNIINVKLYKVEPDKVENIRKYY